MIDNKMERFEIKLTPVVQIEMILIEGEFLKSPRPKENSNCQVKISSIKKLFDIPSEYFEKHFQGRIVIGEGNSVIDRGLDLCLQAMQLNHVVKFSLWNKEPENTILAECLIKLEQFSFEDNILHWPDNKKLTIATHHKSIGVELFKIKRNKDAFYRFSKAFKILKCIDNENDDVKNLIINLYNNMAQCHLLERNFVTVVELCSKLLEFDPENVKALYRRGNAYFELNQFSVSSEDFTKVLELEPFNNIAKERLLISKQNEKVQDADFVAIVKKMFI